MIEWSEKMKKGLTLSMIISLITAIIAVCVIVNTEGEIPIHWNIAGEVDDYGSALTLLIFPVVSFFTALLLYFLPKIDPKGENIEKSGPILPILMVLIALLMLGIEIIIVMAINGSNILNMMTFISLLFAVLFTVMGYYMPRIKPNYMLGIRTPWTLYSEKSWVKTHTASKNWFIANGILFLVCMPLSEPYNILIPLLFMAIVMIGIVVYSYVVYAEEKKEQKDGKKNV